MDYRYNIKLSSGSFFYFSEKFKNLKPFFEDFWSWIKGLFEKGKDFLSVFSKSTRETYERLGIEIKKARKSPVIGSAGGAIKTLLEEGKYALMKDGKEIFRGTQKEVEELAEKLKGMSDEAAEKYLKEVLEISKHKITINYISKLKPLVLNEKLPKQIAEATNNFKRYLVRLEEGFLKTKDVLFDSNGEYVDWIITNENELLFGHGHDFLSKHSKNIKNAGTSIIENGKIIKISNGSGHYTPMPRHSRLKNCHRCTDKK